MFPLLLAMFLDPELALKAPPVIVPPPAEYQDENRYWQGIPGVERSKGGTLWATWYSGGVGEGPKNFVVLTKSMDQGETWSKPLLIVDPPDPVRAYDPVLWSDPQGKLWLFWAQSAGQWDGRGGVWAIVSSNPDAPTPKWSKPRRIAPGVMMNKPTVLSNGHWLLPISGWRFKKPDIEKPLEKMGFPSPAEAAAAFAKPHAEHAGATVYRSTDNGRSFTYVGEALAPEPQFDEHMVVERKDGSLWMWIRTYQGISQSESSDKGATWTPGSASGIPHPATRFHLRRLPSGKLLLVRNEQDPARPNFRRRMVAFLSDDDGKSWNGGLLLDERDNVSYPDAALAPGGGIYVIYDRERSGAREILCARIREEDIVAGKLVSPGSKLRLLVNQATGKRIP